MLKLCFYCLVLTTLTLGEVPSCSDFIKDEIQEQERVHVETDVYVKGRMEATLHIPKEGVGKSDELNVAIKLSREVDEFTSEVAEVSGGKEEFTLRPVQAMTNGTAEEADLTLSLPFVIKYTGATPALEVAGVDVNGKPFCAKPQK